MITKYNPIELIYDTRNNLQYLETVVEALRTQVIELSKALVKLKGESDAK